MRLTRFGFLLALYLAGLSVPGALLAVAFGPGLGGDAAVLWTVGGSTAAITLY